MVFYSNNSHCVHSIFHSGFIEGTTITTDDIKKLLRESVELQKMKVINQKIKETLNEKHAELRKLQKKLNLNEKIGEVNLVINREKKFLFYL